MITNLGFRINNENPEPILRAIFLIAHKQPISPEEVLRPLPHFSHDSHAAMNTFSEIISDLPWNELRDLPEPV